jgi:hypothetical protein
MACDSMGGVSGRWNCNCCCGPEEEEVEEEAAAAVVDAVVVVVVVMSTEEEEEDGACCSAAMNKVDRDVEMPNNFIKTAKMDGAATRGADAARSKARN